ncbi:hypothetical protein R3P38DRAFT_3002668 [Favolaschia claudopus]|uniref:MYND-type domain-containing protein n=1 Tax=Favolaschia claudopus TaxID=2862362 RepID=A0AAW0ALY3_9AGAR
MEIQELAVGPGDFGVLKIAEASFYWFSTDYERIEERGWGCMSSESPVSGLCTDLVNTCIVFVLHCETNARTALCHVVSGTDRTVFDSQILYVSDSRKEGNRVDIIAFLGHTYGLSPVPPDVTPEMIQDDLLWASQTVDFLKTDGVVRGAYVHPKPLPFGAVLVQNSTGRITVLTRPIRFTEALPELLPCLPPSFTFEDLKRRQFIDSLYQIQSTSSFIASEFTRAPCFQVYDGIQRLAVPPLIDDARDVFRIASMHPNFPALEPIQKRDIDIAKRVVSSNEMKLYIYCLSKQIQAVGALCDEPSCWKFTKQRCSKCKGAYYCSKEHQDGQWALHKGWCKTRRFVPGGSLVEGARIEDGTKKAYSEQGKMPWM